LKNKTPLDHLDLLLEMMRLRNCTMSFLSVILGASLIDPAQTLGFKILLAAVSAFIVTGAGNIINDYFDYEIDKINRPKRPLPSNKIRRSDALMLSVALFFIGLGIANSINFYCLGLALINSLILIIYGRYSKTLYLWSNLMVAFLVASIFIYGAFATLTGYRGEGPIPMDRIILLAILATSSFFLTLAREITKDIEDMEGDIKKYSVTIPIRHGPRTAKNWATTFLYLAIIIGLIPILWYTPIFNQITYAIIILIADLIFLYSLKAHPALSQRIMVAGMMMSLLAFFLGEITFRLF
jgi:geranylgeranylglycerol-phosphate geranylgeranyltransferase